MKRALAPQFFPFDGLEREARSLGVEANGRAWLSRAGGARLDQRTGRTIATGPLAEQDALAAARLGLVLEAGDLGPENAVKQTDFVTARGLAAYGSLERQRRDLWENQAPAVSTVLVNGLLTAGAEIESELLATTGSVQRFRVAETFGGVPAAEAAQAGDLLYLATLLPTDPASGRFPSGLIPQAEQIYRNAEGLLREAGVDWPDVVRTREFIDASALPDYRETWRVRAAHFGAPGTAAVAATGIPMRSLVAEGALLQVEFTAHRGGGRPINPGWTRYERLTYAPGVQAGDVIFLSGFVATDSESGELQAPGDLAGQALAVYSGIRLVLEAVGLDLNAVVKTTEYITPEAGSRYADVVAVRRECFAPPFPAATAVVCERLLRPGALIEIDCVAVT
jgi:enamine deaminase RidA (YjgF/YER057c/UK114 family)